MAKVNYPLFSGSAKGRIGNLIVFYGDGKARAWSTQKDPQTINQTRSRIVVGEIMARIKLSSGIDRAWMRAAISKSWHVVITAWLTRNSLANAQACFDEWNAFSPAQRSAWESIAQG